LASEGHQRRAKRLSGRHGRIDAARLPRYRRCPPIATIPTRLPAPRHITPCHVSYATPPPLLPGSRYVPRKEAMKSATYQRARALPLICRCRHTRRPRKGTATSWQHYEGGSREAGRRRGVQVRAECAAAAVAARGGGRPMPCHGRYVQPMPTDRM